MGILEGLAYWEPGKADREDRWVVSYVSAHDTLGSAEFERDRWKRGRKGLKISIRRRIVKVNRVELVLYVLIIRRKR